MKNRTTKICLVVFCLLLPITGFTLNTSHWRLSPEGLGPIHIGMSLKEITSLTKKNFTHIKPEEYEDKSCFTTKLKSASLSGVSFMIAYNKVVRVNVSTKQFTTSRGVRIGDTEEKVKKLYGDKLVVSTHHYDEKGHYLMFTDKPHNLAIRFETNGKIVTLMYAGKIEQVNYVEDCL